MGLNNKIFFRWFFRWSFFFCVLITSVVKGQSQVHQIEDLLATYHEYGLFNGSVLVAKNGKILYKGGFGEANMTWDIPNRPETKFRIGSATKQFTATLILKLVEEGKLDLQGKITDYLPEYPAPQGNKITIHHLLTHTSGLPSYTTPDFMSDQVRDPFPPDSLIALFSDMELQFEPGTKWSYSNSGYIVLGAIIEKVTGQPYDRVLQQRILEPFGLKNTGYDHYGHITKHFASGYFSTPAGYERAPYLDTSVPFSAGMLYSTVEDLFHWDQLLYGDKIFEHKETKEQLFAPQTDIPEAVSKQANLPPHYGYGWSTGTVTIGSHNIQMIEHGGSIFGFSTGFWRMPEEHNTVIIMDNSSSREVRNLGHDLISILYGDMPEPPGQPISRLMFQWIDSLGVEPALRRYNELFRDKHATFNFQESQLNSLGYYYLNSGEVNKAIAVLKLNVQSYPESANTYDSLGEAYLKAGRDEKALEYYQKSLQLNPENANAEQILQHLRAKLN